MESGRFPTRVAELALLTLLTCLLALTPANAKYIKPDLINIPITRLITNLETQLRNEPKNVEVRFNLARAHAMAYAEKTETVGVWKGKENEGVWFGYGPNHIPFKVTPTDDRTKLTAAREHLEKALEHYGKVVELAPENLSAALGYAWCLEQAGQKRNAVRLYKAVIKAAWEKEKNLTRAGLGWHSITAEAAGYLIPLLDKKRDAREISTLKRRVELMSRVRRPITPIVIPMRDNLNAHDLQDREAQVAFDADGTGQRNGWTWITRDAGWLVYDPHRTGKVTSALQLFGGVTFWMFWENGYNALISLDDDRDGILSGKELDGIAIWNDRNVNGVSEPGDIKTLAELGIVAISCRYIRDLTHPDRIAYSPGGVVFRDGSTRPSYDIVLRPARMGID